jgi:putative peptidoglycan lipid II flippase
VSHPASAADDSAGALLRHSAVMSVGTALSRLTGFLRLTAMAWALGITETRIADAYNTANTTPNIIYELALGGILSAVFVPVFVEWLERRGRDEAFDVARRVLTITVALLSGIMVLGIIFAPWILRLYTVGIDDSGQRAATEELGTFFLRFFMPQIVFYGIGAVATGLLNAHRRFAAPMFAPILNNLTVIVTFIIYGTMAGPGRADPTQVVTMPEKLVLAIGTTLGVIFMTAALWPSLRGIGFRFHWRGNWRHEAVLRIAHLAKWTVVYVLANQIGYLIVLMLALHQQGGYTAYGAAFILFQLPYAIFAVSIFTALLPAMSSRWSAGDIGGFRAMLTQGLRMTGFIVIPASFGYMVLAGPIVALLLQHGVAGAGSTELVSQMLTLFSIGLFSFAGFQLMLRAFYSMQDTRTPALVNIVSLAVNVTANLLFVFVFGMGVRGLALGHATAYTIAAAILLVLLRRRLQGLDGRTLGVSLLRILVAAVFTAAAAWATSTLIVHAAPAPTPGRLTLQVLVSVAVGLIVFLIAATVLRMEELAMVKRSLMRRFAH